MIHKPHGSRNMVAQEQHWFNSNDGSRTMMAQEQ
jgi:hypothetical protein